ncbi:MAG TPA: zf-HC2 domain-containing protein [Thermoanaerobaculia bacterium]|nr:zf-HC2 domain-containing protein [Thermoanaerobaculia bacterium]
MEHTEAIKEMMVERYALEELTPEKREEFEEHFFDCPECAAAVSDTNMLMESGRAAVKEVPVPVVDFSTRRAQWQARIATAAAVMAVGFAGYQNILQFPARMTAVLQQQRTSRQPEVTSVLGLASLSRGDDSASAKDMPQIRADRDANLSFDVTDNASHERYRFEIRGRAGFVRSAGSLDASAAKAVEGLNLSIPAGTLPEGEYVLVVLGEQRRGGAAAEEVGTTRFRVRAH